MFEPQRRADNKQLKRKDKKRPCITKRTISSKKMLYEIFFNSSGPVVQVPCPSGQTVTGRFCKNSVLKKVIYMASRFTIYSINQISDLIYQISYIIYKVSDILY